METTHTKAPWFDWERQEWIHDPQKLLTNYPDACLMAAAPEMFEACRKAMTCASLPDSVKEVVRSALARASS